MLYWIGKGFGVIAVILAMWAEVVFAPSGVWPFIAALSLVSAGVAGLLKETPFSVVA